MNLPTPPEGSRENKPEAVLDRVLEKIGLIPGSRAKDWREARFNEIFKDVTTINNTPIAEIRELFHSYEEEVRGMVEGMHRSTVYEHNELPEPRPDYMCGHAQSSEERNYGYNQALTDVLDRLKTLTSSPN